MIAGVEHARVVVLGVGNVLLGDDGFGPAVAEWLSRQADLPADVLVADVGTAVREVLFDLVLSDRRPERLVVIDAVYRPGRPPGEVVTLRTEDLPPTKLSDFSLHQFPAVCLLSELEELAGVDVTIVAVQVAEAPAYVGPGLSAPLVPAVAQAGEFVKALIGEARR